MNRLTVLTYPLPHRKTYDLLTALKAHGASDVTVIAVPFSYEKQVRPLIEHRPAPLFDISAECLADALGFTHVRWRYLSYKGIERVIPTDVLLIAGATILPPELVAAKTVINSHPGLLPYVRGLDAVKWAVWYGEDVGVTVHRATPTPDAGPIYKQEPVEVEPTDTFQSFATRVYETEIRLLVDMAIAGCLPEEQRAPDLVDPATGAEYQANRRMPRKLELLLPQAFETWKLGQIQQATG